MPKFYQGSIPHQDAIIVDNNFIDNNGSSWVVAIRSTDEWFNITFHVRGKRRSKANFYLAWNGERFANGNCFKAATKNMPEIIDKAMLVIDEYA